MTLDPRERVPCSCGAHGFQRGVWATMEGEILARDGLHRPVLECLPLAQLDSERATLARQLG